MFESHSFRMRSDLLLLLILALLCAVIGGVRPVFLSPSNLMNLLQQAAVITVIAVGMTLVVVTGGIDLSVGSVTALCGVVLAQALASGHPLPSALALCAAAGAAAGCVNGALVGYGRVPAFIATLGMMSAARGLTLILTGGRSVSGFGESFLELGAGVTWGVPHPVWVMLFAAAAAGVFLHATCWGLRLFAIGGSAQAASLCGIRVRRYLMLVYCLSGLAAAAAGVLLTARLNSAQPTAGAMYELDAIAAVVIGGASLSGGRATVWGTAMGALLLAVLKNGLNILDMSSYVQQVAVGAVIVLAVLADRARAGQS